MGVFGGSGGKCIDKIFLLKIMYFRMLFNEAGRTTSYLLADMPSGRRSLLTREVQIFLYLMRFSMSTVYG
jgi:hypothetical protein